MFRKSLLAAALLSGTSLGAMAGTVTPLTNALSVRRRHLWVPAYRRHPSLSRRPAYRTGTVSSRTMKKGSYVNGSFFPAAALPPNYIPYATSGGVLPDGRVLLIGGEYTLGANNTLTFDLTNKMAIWDPKADKWTMVAPPSGPGWDLTGNSPWTMLSNGHPLLGNDFNKHMAELDPETLRWTEVYELRQR